MSEGTFYWTKSYCKCFEGLGTGDLCFLFTLVGGIIAFDFFKAHESMFLTIYLSSSWINTFYVGYFVDNYGDYD